MHHVLSLVLLTLAGCTAVLSEHCSVSTHDEGEGEWLKCFNSSLAEATFKATDRLSAISISQSEIPSIPSQAFFRFGRHLKTLNLLGCKIRTIDNLAFSGLSSLKKLSLSSNNIIMVHVEWFKSLPSLEDLDLSFNSIGDLETAVFENLSNLRRLDLSNNRLMCLRVQNFEPLRSLSTIRFDGNPLSYSCRAKSTLWLKDHGINYESNSKDFESQLNTILWLCSMNAPEIVEDENLSEIRMRECGLFQMFLQMKTALVTSDTYGISAEECPVQRSSLLQCVRNTGQNMTNGEVIKKLLLALRQAKLQA